MTTAPSAPAPSRSAPPLLGDDAAERARSWGVPTAIAASWAVFAEADLPQRSGCLRVTTASWMLGEYRTKGRADAWDRLAAEALAQVQVCAEDLIVLLQAREGTGMISPQGAVDLLAEALRAVAVIRRGMGVRDALGWLMSNRDLVVRPISLAEWLAVQIPPWDRVGLADTGWLYAAAGFTADEARAALDAGALTEEAARAVAGMRTLPLPA